jgi:hypothetical protein
VQETNPVIASVISRDDALPDFDVPPVHQAGDWENVVERARRPRPLGAIGFK